MSTCEWRNGEFIVSCNPEKQDVDVIRAFLTNAPWSKGISRALVHKSINNSLCFALLHHGAQIGFARVISDRATVAYLGDVFVLPPFRGRGLAKWLVECVCGHPELQHLRRWLLVTSDAHGLYEKFGFRAVANSALFMERHDAMVYERGEVQG